jgi:hypothetical protein
LVGTEYSRILQAKADAVQDALDIVCPAIDVLTRRVFELECENGWHPIETIPVDGSDVQVWSTKSNVTETIRYEKYEPQDAAEVGEIGYWRYSEDLLDEVAGASFDISEYSHWRRSPAPPK